MNPGQLDIRCADCGAELERSSSACPTCGSRSRTMVPANWGNPAPQMALAAVAGASIAMPMGTANPVVRKARPIRRSKRGHVRKLPLLLGVLMLLASGWLGIGITQSVDEIYSVAQPPAAITGDRLGGDPSIIIDTGPAAAAVAAANATATAEAKLSPSATATAQATQPSAATTATADTAVDSTDGQQQTAVSSDPTPAAAEPTTPALVLSEIERVGNGDFESGVDGWYIDEGTGVVEMGAKSGNAALSLGNGGGYADQDIYLIPGATYRLSAWGRLSIGNDRATIGIIYRDENGNRLEGIEPAPLVFTETSYTQQTLEFTPPANVAEMKAYVWKESGAASFFADDLSVRTLVDVDAAGDDVVGDSPSMTILLMGVDRRPGEPLDYGIRADTLMVLSLNSEMGTCKLLSVPRDSRVELPGYGMTKINNALAVGGIPYQKLVVEQFLGISIDHYMLLDFTGFAETIDVMGGIDVEVTQAFTSDDGNIFTVGTERMSGERALSYARWRGDNRGDFGRMERQQAVLRGILEKTSGLNAARAVEEMLPAIETNLRTDLEPRTLVSVANQYRQQCTAETVTMDHLEGTLAWYDDPLLQMPQNYVEVDPADIRRKVAVLMGTR